MLGIMHIRNMKYLDIASRMKDIRLNARLTQKDMAKIVGLTPGSVGAIENGAYTPNFDVLRALKTKLGVSYDFVIDGTKSDVNASQLASENKALREELDRLRRMVDRLLDTNALVNAKKV